MYVSLNPVQFKCCTHPDVINAPQCVSMWSRVLWSSTCPSKPPPYDHTQFKFFILLWQFQMESEEVVHGNFEYFMHVESNIININFYWFSFFLKFFVVLGFFLLYFINSIELCLFLGSDSHFIIPALAHLGPWNFFFHQKNIQNDALNSLVIRITLRLIKK